MLQQGYGTQSFAVSGPGPLLAKQQFGVEEGPFLQTIDMIVDMGRGALKFPSGGGGLHGEARQYTPPPAVAKLMREWD